MDAKGTIGRTNYLVECFWPGVTRAAHEEADRRLRTVARELEPELGPLLYLGSLLVPEDEVVFLQFEAANPEACRTVAARAGVVHERVLQSFRLTGGDRPARP